jgi:hypothetical protein
VPDARILPYFLDDVCLACLCQGSSNRAASFPPAKHETRDVEPWQNKSSPAEAGVFRHAAVKGGDAVEKVEQGEREHKRRAEAKVNVF